MFIDKTVRGEYNFTYSCEFSLNKSWDWHCSAIKTTIMPSSSFCKDMKATLILVMENRKKFHWSSLIYNHNWSIKSCRTMWKLFCRSPWQCVFGYTCLSMNNFFLEFKITQKSPMHVQYYCLILKHLNWSNSFKTALMHISIRYGITASYIHSWERPGDLPQVVDHLGFPKTACK